MFAAMFGSAESLLILAFVACFGLVLFFIAGLIIYFIRRADRPKSGLQPLPPAPVFTKTQIMPRQCPRCGAALPPDAPEGLCPACLLQRGFATEAGAASRPSDPNPQPTGAPSAPPPFAPPSFSELSQLFPQLEILECLGRGGMGAVYKARQPRLDRLVALKILAPEKQNDPQFAERFEREARALARLNHPNIVTVFDFGEVQGRFYLLMEFVDGLTLRQVLQNGKLSPAEALQLVPKICEALQFAHEHGIIHRDIKPENILLDKQGRVKIADFGIAKIAGLESKDFSLTAAGDVMGTPHYMAPEQVETPLTVDHRADIYSLGVVFYEMLTGELPLGKFAPPSSKVQMDVRLDEVVLHALEKEPARRYQQASQVKTAVETIAGTPPPFAPGAAAGAAAASPLPAAIVANVSDKIILPAFLLAFFFGVFGAHRFYVGKIGTAILQLCTCGGFGVWATIDWILLVCKAFTDGQGRRMTNWIHHPSASAEKSIAPAPAPRSANPPKAAQPGQFWRRFAIVAACIILIPIALLIIILAVAAFTIPHFGTATAEAKPLTAEELQKAGIRQEGGEFFKESSQSLPLDADGRFSVDNVNGRIEIHGWSSNTVVLHTTIHGKTGEGVNGVKINVDSEPERVNVHTELPSGAKKFRWSLEWFKNAWRDTATVDYTIQVPQHAQLANVSSVNGHIKIDGVTGSITTSTVNGETQIKNAAQNLKLSTVNGTITADMDALGSGQSVSLDAVNGEITLAVPEDADANFSVTTMNGSISSEFPALPVKKKFPVGNDLHGSLGNGSANVKVDTVNGTVQFLKSTAAKPTGTNAVPSIPLSSAGNEKIPATKLPLASPEPI